MNRNIHVRLSEEMHDLLIEKTKQFNCSYSELIRRAIRAYVGEYKPTTIDV